MGAVVRAGALFAFPAGLGMAALAGPLARLLYGEGPSTPVVARCLELLGLAALASAMSGPLSSMLQAVGRADLPVKLLLGAMALKLGASWGSQRRPPGPHLRGAPEHPFVLRLFDRFPVLVPKKSHRGAAFRSGAAF